MIIINYAMIESVSLLSSNILDRNSLVLIVPAYPLIQLHCIIGLKCKDERKG